MHRVDYDLLAPLYDEPSRDQVVDPNLVSFLRERSEAPATTLRILDIGCGTGKQLAANLERFPAMQGIGVDRFAGMLRIARNRCPYARLIQGDGARLPLASGIFDYSTSQFAYPHIRNTEAFVQEAFRTLKPGGRFVMTNIDPWSMSDWIVYGSFPDARKLDHADFLPVDDFVRMMRQAGFQDVIIGRIDRSSESRLAEFLAFARNRYRTSQLMGIPDEAYEAGLRRLEAEVIADGDAVVKSAFVLVTISGHKERFMQAVV